MIVATSIIGISGLFTSLFFKSTPLTVGLIIQVLAKVALIHKGHYRSIYMRQTPVLPHKSNLLAVLADGFHFLLKGILRGPNKSTAGALPRVNENRKALIEKFGGNEELVDQSCHGRSACGLKYLFTFRPSQVFRKLQMDW